MSSYLEFLKSPKDEIIIPFLDTLMRSAPDSIVLGSFILSLLTQSYCYMVLLLAFIEIIGIHTFIAKIASFLTGSAGVPLPSDCGFMIPSYTQISILKYAMTSDPFPSAPIFFISAVIAYFLGSTIDEVNEITDLAKTNSVLKARFPISVVLSILFLSAFSVYRIVKGCDNLLASMGSIILGIIVGGSLLMLNIQIFGRDSVNFTGLPLLVDRISTGQPLYVCTNQG